MVSIPFLGWKELEENVKLREVVGGLGRWGEGDLPDLIGEDETVESSSGAASLR